jgi:TetR/AcrR family fatty acid metabolism transcriptional regulator
MSPKIVNKEEKKTDIIHAAMIVFAQKGLVKTKMIDIAQQAGIGKGTIYEYFRSKEDIFTAAFSLFFSDINSAIEKNLSNTDDPVEQLKLLMKVSVQSMNHYGSDFAAIMMDFWAEGIRTKDERILSIINLKKIYEDYRRSFRMILENGINTGVFKPVNTLYTSAVLIAAFDGLLLQWIMDRELIDPEKATDALICAFLDGIKK